MATSKHTYWGYTLNNYTEAELVLIRTPPEWVREHIYTLERGEEGTPHVQGFFRLKTDQRMSYITKRWLPRANLRFLDGDEYRENMRAYVQKQDETAISATHQVRNTDPMLYPALIPELLVKEVLEWELPDYQGSEGYFFAGKAPADLTELIQQVWHVQASERGLLHCRCWWNECPETPPSSSSDDVLLFPIPWELALEVAKHTLVRKYRVETLVNRPEVNSALRSFRLQIMERIKQNANQTHDDEETFGEEIEIPVTDEASGPSSTDAASS